LKAECLIYCNVNQRKAEIKIHGSIFFSFSSESAVAVVVVVDVVVVVVFVVVVAVVVVVPSHGWLIVERPIRW